MTSDTFFAFDSYHIALAVIGLIIVASRWLPRLFSSREPAAAPLMILLGFAAALIVPGMPEISDPRSAPKIWEIVSEVTVIIALFGAGMRVDSIGPISKWNPTIRLLAIAMPITIVAVVALGVTVAGLTLGSAVLLAAVLAPTDPVLAADVQIAPPQQGQEHPVRFALTTEAALNDGLAFPFVYLALLVVAQGWVPGAWGWDWFAIDVLYRIVVGCVLGGLGGWALGQILFKALNERRLAETGSGVIAIAGVFLCYGSTELLEGYGFIAVAVMGLTLRRIETDHDFHVQLHDFSEAIEHALTAVLLIALGAVLPVLFRDLDWSHVVISVVILALVRPIAGILSFSGSKTDWKDRWIISIYGVRGIGSIYYLAYAATHAQIEGLDALWSLVALTILLSTMVHGFSVGWAMSKIGR